MLGTAHAGWEYPGYYIGDGVYADDGSRLTLGVRGGFALVSAGISNEAGSLITPYYDDGGFLIPANYCGTACGSLPWAGDVDLGKFGAAKEMFSYSWSAGVSFGWTFPTTPQWRMELDWNHIARVQYNAEPALRGDLQGVEILAGGIQSSMNTDIISAVFYYDFYDGLVKPLRQIIPYLGIGFGYAHSDTVLNLTDLYYNLSGQGPLIPFVEDENEYGDWVFYQSQGSSSNVAGVLAAGMSYGLEESVFLDLGVRLNYIPKITWELNNGADATALSYKSRNWFSAENVMIVNFNIGVRFEF